MKFAAFFIDRPIFAAVLSIFIFIAGVLAVWQLPISEYPEVAPPSVNVRASYPGADPTVVAETVAAPLEEVINGVENMLYMSSQAAADGSLSISVTFKLGTDGDLSQQLVQNRVSQALPRLPDAVRNIGVTVTKSSPDLTMVVHLVSPEGKYDALYLRNYVTLNIRDQLAKLQGVGDARVFGAGDYAMRLWLDPRKMAARGISARDIVAAVREQNAQVAAGTIGGEPSEDGVMFELPVTTPGRLASVEEFGNIILKVDEAGGVVHLRDVARVELGAAEYGLRSLLNNQQAVAIPIFQMPEANAIAVSDVVRARMAELARDFPEGMEYRIVYDPTVFVRSSIKAVVMTLLEAVALVVLVVIVFLQTWRASIIPLLAVPVSIIGTFAVMLAAGFSINALTLFGLVLSVGIVVDDAIVVVENVQRNIENGLSPRDATRQAMREVTGPIIAMTLVLLAVFVPLAFITGLTGQFYRQFAMTISISALISAFNSLTLSPAMSALLLRPIDAPPDWLTRKINGVFGGFFNWFNRVFRRSSARYERGLHTVVLRRRGLTLLVYLALLFITWLFFANTSTDYVPPQDKQYLIAFTNLPSGSSLDRTEAVMRQMSDILLEQPGVRNAIAFPGLSIAGFSRSSNSGIIFVGLDPFEERGEEHLSAMAITGALNQKFQAIPEAFVTIFPPPPVRGLGTIGGFKLQLQDRMGAGMEELNRMSGQVLGAAMQRPEIASAFTNFQISTPQLLADIDRTRAKQLGLSLDDVFTTLQVYLGSFYINDFNLFGRTYRVVAQADAPYRAQAGDITGLEVRNADGQMVPLGSVLKVEQTYGPDRAMRYNAYPTADINANAAPGYSQDAAKAAMVEVMEEVLPQGFGYEWTDLTYQQILAGDTTFYVFPLCVLFVFMVLAAQYESLSLPLSIILIVPMCLLCAIFGVWLMDKTNNIFTQIGFIVLVGLACKNAILIVEFARELEHEGRSIVEAAIEASGLRLRPILMTSFAFIMGVVPLMLSTGAGAEMRNDMGIAVFSGMLGVTFFGLALTPVFYVVVRNIAERMKERMPHA